jgi:hypothetical protein
MELTRAAAARSPVCPDSRLLVRIRASRANQDRLRLRLDVDVRFLVDVFFREPVDLRDAADLRDALEEDFRDPLDADLRDEDADFFREDEAFLRGTLAPARRASLSPIAIACFRLVTFLPDPERRVPCLRSCITFFTFCCALRPYFAIVTLLVAYVQSSVCNGRSAEMCEPVTVTHVLGS